MSPVIKNFLVNYWFILLSFFIVTSNYYYYFLGGCGDRSNLGCWLQNQFKIQALCVIDYFFEFWSWTFVWSEFLGSICTAFLDLCMFPLIESRYSRCVLRCSWIRVSLIFAVSAFEKLFWLVFVVVFVRRSLFFFFFFLVCVDKHLSVDIVYWIWISSGRWCKLSVLIFFS